ncbi:hypothetical protein [Limnoglobus roseus]|nr:hypothetical protein [Limnoglobus roseus]
MKANATAPASAEAVFALDLVAVLNALDRAGKPVAHLLIPIDQFDDMPATDLAPDGRPPMMGGGKQTPPRQGRLSPRAVRQSRRGSIQHPEPGTA